MSTWLEAVELPKVLWDWAPFKRFIVLPLERQGESSANNSVKGRPDSHTGLCSPSVFKNQSFRTQNTIFFPKKCQRWLLSQGSSQKLFIHNVPERVCLHVLREVVGTRLPSHHPRRQCFLLAVEIELPEVPWEAQETLFALRRSPWTPLWSRLLESELLQSQDVFLFLKKDNPIPPELSMFWTFPSSITVSSIMAIWHHYWI